MSNATVTKPTDRLLPVAVAAERMGYSRIAMYELCAAGKIRHCRLPGTGERKNIRIPESAVEELIQRSTCGGEE